MYIIPATLYSLPSSFNRTYPHYPPGVICKTRGCRRGEGVNLNHITRGSIPINNPANLGSFISPPLGDSEGLYARHSVARARTYTSRELSFGARLWYVAYVQASSFLSRRISWLLERVKCVLLLREDLKGKLLFVAGREGRGGCMYEVNPVFF